MTFASAILTVAAVWVAGGSYLIWAMRFEQSMDETGPALKELQPAAIVALIAFIIVWPLVIGPLLVSKLWR